MTHLVLSSVNQELLGYFSLTVKPISIPAKFVEISNTTKRKWAKFASYDRDRNVYVDLSYYMNIFLENNVWTMKKGFNLFYEFMNRMINNPNLPNYSKKTIMIPVIDWDRTHDSQLWNFKKCLSPVSIIYWLMYNGNQDQLLKLFGNHDIIFAGNNKYFKMNFKQMKDEGMDLKKWSSKFKIFVVKFAKMKNLMLKI